MSKRSDPRQTTVQVNLRIPWILREYLAYKAENERKSQNQLVVDALSLAYDDEFVPWATREMGSTK